MQHVATTMAGMVFLTLGCAGSTQGSTGTTTGATTAATTGGTLLKAGGQPCASDNECASTYCGAPVGSDGGGNCCVGPCALGKKPCQFLGCDGNGACYYPNTEKACDPYSPYCLGNALVTRACNGAGGCEILSASTCPDNFACNNEGDDANYDAGFDAGCNTTCTRSIDCALGFVCNAEACVLPVDTGACTENDDCSSGVCGITGSGHCCSEACGCEAADCDPDTGACLCIGDGG